MELLFMFVLLEILADPAGNDNNQEFVEFSFNYEITSFELTNTTNKSSETNATLDLISYLKNTSFVFSDAASNDTLEYLTTIGDANSSEQFLLIVEEGFNYSQIRTNNTCHIFSAGATIGNGLGNDEDTILFSHNNTVLVNKSYALFGCASGEGCSLHENNNTFIAQEASPCSETEFDVQEPTCELNLSLEAETIYELGEAIRFTPKITGENYTLLYWWEDLYGNVLKKPTSTTNNNPKQYTPAQPEDEKDFAVLLYAKLENHCNETQESHLAVVKGEAREQSSTTSSSSSSAQGSSGGSSTFSKPLFTFSVPKTSYGNISLTTTIYYPEQKGSFQIASYAYRGSTNYSSREKRNITVNDLNVSHTNINLEPGNYSLKTQVWFPGRKTPEEERREITILAMPVTKTQINTSPVQETTIPRIQSRVVDSEEQAVIPWTGLLFGLGLAILALIRHRSDDSEKKIPSLLEQDLQDQSQENASEKNTTLHTWLAKEKNLKAAAHQRS